MKTGAEQPDPFDELTTLVLRELRDNGRMRLAWDGIHEVTQRQIHRRIAGILRRAKRRGIPIRGEVGE